jgi:hypothetical protein
MPGCGGRKRRPTIDQEDYCTGQRYLRARALEKRVVTLAKCHNRGFGLASIASPLSTGLRSMICTVRSVAIVYVRWPVPIG